MNAIDQRGAVQPQPLDIGRLRFLVVEDHDFQRWAVANMLERLGARYVFSATDGKSALEVIRGLDQPVDIILSDLDMPGMDGMEFIRHVGEVGEPVSLILSSGLDRSLVSSVETMAHAYGLNLLGAIEKPVTAKSLEALIRRHEPSRGAGRAPAPSFPIEEILDGLRGDQFEPFFQPKVELASRAVKGAEAVARWRHPARGIVIPHAFIKQLEDCGHIEELTEIMLAKAVAACRAWVGAGIDASVAVNLSPRLLNDVGLADRMLRLLEETRIEPRHLIFEVTESAAASDPGKALENLSRLRMKGFGLSIDDYGTGYSSMQQLARIAFTELKIDQSFVKGAATNDRSRAVLESSLEIAQKLRIVAVAEGVESAAEWELLRGLGCQLAQGYYIAKPMPAEEFAAWLRA